MSLLAWALGLAAVDEMSRASEESEAARREAELYKKYKLTKEEIAFIESMIKPME